MKKYLQLIFTVLFLLPVVSRGQVTYTWNVASGDWTTAGNWTPSRDVTATNDVLVFDGSTQATPTVTSIPKETIGQLKFINNVSATFSSGTAASGTGTITRSTTTVTGSGTSFTTEIVVGDIIYGNTTVTPYDVTAINSMTSLTTSQSGVIASQNFSIAPKLTISGGASAFSIESGSTLTINTSSVPPILIYVASGSTGSISGTLTVGGGAERISSPNAAGITFSNGSIFNQSTSFTGNAFGLGTTNSIIFSSGSIFNFTAGSNPFGTTSGVCQFQTGSLYSHKSSSTPAFSGRTYANFDYSNSGSASATGSSAVVMDTLTISAGTFNFNVTGTPGHSIKGNISVASDATLNFSPASSGTVNLNGTSSQSLGGSGTINISTSNLTLVLSNSQGLTLTKSITIPGTLTLTSGNITTNSNILTIASGGSVSRTSGHIIGSLKKNSVSGSQIFDVGTSSGYTPVSMAITGTGDFTVQTVSGKHPNAVGGNVLGMYWILTNGGITSADLQFTYLSGDVTGTESNYTIGKYSASTWTFPTTSLDTGAKIASTAGVSSFSDFTLGESSALPVQLVSFSAYTNNKKVNLSWRTATEVNNYGFEVERRQTSNVKSETWEKIGFVNGNGNSNSPKSYSFSDEPYGGKEFKYRLKQIDFDGKFEYTDEVTAVFEDVTTFELEQNYPNPFNPSTKISYTIPQRSNVKLRVYNMLAQMEAELVNESQEAGHYQVIFNGSNLPSGTYFYKLEAGKFVEVKKFLLVK